MKKNVRILIILGIIIAALAAGTGLIMNMDKEKAEESQGGGQEKKERFLVYKADEDKIKKIMIAIGAETITAADENGTRTINGLDPNETDATKIDHLFSAVSVITSNNKIEEAPSDTAQYGLDDPFLTVVIEFDDGTSDTLLIGDKSPTLGEYFITSADDGAVYTISEGKVDTIRQKEAYYTAFDRFTANIDDIMGIRIERSDTVIDLRVAENIERTINDVWEMKSPYDTVANDEFVDDTILTSIEAISLNAPLSDGLPHGTDSPYARLTLEFIPFNYTDGTYSDAYTEELAIGDSEDGVTYVGYEGNVFAVSSTVLEFVSTQPFNIVNKLQAMVPVRDISSLEISSGSETRKMDVTHGENESDLSFRLDGEVVDSTVAKKMYQAAAGLAVDGIYAGETLGDTILEFKYTGLDGIGDTKIEFKTIDSLSCALMRNGKAEFTIRRNKIDDFAGVFNAYVNHPNGE